MRHASAGELRSVANALRVMQQLADADRPLAVTELAAVLGIAPSTAHRILATLTAHGYAVRVPAHRRYRAGPALTGLARRSLLDHVRLGEAARPILAQLAQESGETSHLAVLDGVDALGIDHVQSSQPVVAHHPAGSRVPAHATAVGQAILAFLPEIAQRMMRDGLVPHTTRTITDPQAFEQVLADIRWRGYATNVGQLHPETAGVAAPICDANGAVLASVGISGPAARIGRKARLDELASLAVEGARQIGGRLTALEPPTHRLPASEPALVAERRR